MDGQPAGFRWRYYTSDSGGEVVKKELAGLSTGPRTAIKEVMLRAQQGRLQPREDKKLSGTKDLRELRVDIEGDTYRLVYARLRNEQVLLALHAMQKKSQKLPQPALRKAKKRLAEWRARGH